MRRGIIFAAVLLAACAKENSGGGSGATPVDANPLCVSSSCGERVVLLDIPSAENQIFTDDGRLFVSSGSGLWEVTKDASGTYAKTSITSTGLNGLAIIGDVLYATAGNGDFYAGRIGSDLQMTKIFTIAGMCIANGMVAGPDGNLYVVDEPLSPAPPNCIPPDPKVVRLNVDPADPMHILNQEVWIQGSPAGLLSLGLDNVLRFPNGLQRKGNRFFGTDGGAIYFADLQADGSAGPVTKIYWEPTAHDDLGIAGDNLVVTDFFGGRIFLLSQDGELLQQTDRVLFSFPSSTRIGRPPLFSADEVVVTETGVLTDNNLPLDHLSVFRRTSSP
jgi:hypothetical protein